MSRGAALIRANNTAPHLPLADESIDLIITSPPYFAQRTYEDDGAGYDGQMGSEPTPGEFLEALWHLTGELRRVLKPSGSMFVNLGDKYAQGHGGSSTEGNGITIHKRASTDPNPRVRDDLVDAPGPWSTREAAGRIVLPGFAPKSLLGMPWRYAIGCEDRLGFILRAEIVWSKPNPLPESVSDRVRRSHEQWFHFTKRPRYYAAVDEIREPHTGNSNPGRNDGAPPPGGKMERQVAKGDHGGQYKATDPSLFDPRGRPPGSVWSIPSEGLAVPDYFASVDGREFPVDAPELWRLVDARTRAGDWSPVDVFKIDHYAAFPQEWPRRLILGWSPPGYCVECGEPRRPVTESTPMKLRPSSKAEGRRQPGASLTPASGRMLEAPSTIVTGYGCACDEPTAPTRPAVVLDPFVGTGTTIGVARTLGRFGIGLDLSADYLRLARWRVWSSGHFAKSDARTATERQQVLV